VRGPRSGFENPARVRPPNRCSARVPCTDEVLTKHNPPNGAGGKSFSEAVAADLRRTGVLRSDLLLPVSSVAQRLGVSVATVHKAINEGRLRCHLLGCSRRISPGDLEGYIRAQAAREPPTDEDWRTVKDPAPLGGYRGTASTAGDPGAPVLSKGCEAMPSHARPWDAPASGSGPRGRRFESCLPDQQRPLIPKGCNLRGRRLLLHPPCCAPPAPHSAWQSVLRVSLYVRSPRGLRGWPQATALTQYAPGVR